MCIMCRRSILAQTSNWGAYCQNPAYTQCSVPTAQGRNLWSLMDKGRRSAPPSLLNLCKDRLSRTKLYDAISEEFLEEGTGIRPIMVEPPQYIPPHVNFNHNFPYPVGTSIFPLAIPNGDFARLAAKYFYLKYPQFLPATIKPSSPQLMWELSNLLQADDSIITPTYDLYWLVTDLLGFEFTCARRYAEFWTAMLRSRGDILAWQSGNFAVLDIASHLWHRGGPRDPNEIVTDERVPVLYTNNNGFIQQCALSTHFLDYLYNAEDEMLTKFQNEGVTAARLALSNNALYPIDTNDITNLQQLNDGIFTDDMGGDDTVIMTRNYFKRRLMKSCMISSEDDSAFEIGHDSFKTSWTKVFEFYPNSDMVYSCKIVLILEHYHRQEKMGEVHLSKDEFEELMEQWGDHFHEETILNDREKRLNFNQIIILPENRYHVNRFSLLDHHSRSVSINKRFHGIHPTIISDGQETDSDID